MNVGISRVSFSWERLWILRRSSTSTRIRSRLHRKRFHVLDGNSVSCHYKHACMGSWGLTYVESLSVCTYLTVQSYLLHWTIQKGQQIHGLFLLQHLGIVFNCLLCARSTLTRFRENVKDQWQQRVYGHLTCLHQCLWGQNKTFSTTKQSPKLFPSLYGSGFSLVIGFKWI